MRSSFWRLRSAFFCCRKTLRRAFAFFRFCQNSLISKGLCSLSPKASANSCSLKNCVDSNSVFSGASINSRIFEINASNRILPTVKIFSPSSCSSVFSIFFLTATFLPSLFLVQNGIRSKNSQRSGKSYEEKGTTSCPTGVIRLKRFWSPSR